MKPTRLLLPALLLLCAAGAAPPAPAPGARPQEGDFRTVFREAMKINAKTELARLVKTRTPEAIDVIVEICEAISETPSEDLETEIAALRLAWQEAMKSEFVDVQYEYFSLIRPEVRTARRQLRQRFNLEYKRFQEATAATPKDKGLLQEVGLTLLGFGDSFVELGDHYLASQCFINAGICFDTEQRGDSADLRHGCEAFGKGAQARRAAQLLDQIYVSTKLRFEALEAAGFASAMDPTVPAPAAAGEAATALTIPLTFELFADLETVRRPNFLVDPVYQIWPAFYLAGTGSETMLGSIREGSPKVKREGDAKALIDSDADGKPDLDLPLTGKITPVQIEIGEGAEKRPWAFLATIGQAQDTYQGLRFNLGPGDENLAIYVAPAGSMVGTIGATTVRVLDDNLDGVYGSPPLEWGHVGTVEGSFQRDLDSILVGESKVAQPWSELVDVGGSWYKLESQHGGKELLATPTKVQTGTLVLDFRGPPVDWVVVRGEVAANEKLFFEVARAGKTGIQVPAGPYRLYCGQVSQGKGNQMMKALILPGVNTATWSVGPGEKAVIALGEPFGMTFEVVQDEEKVRVVGASIAVVGRGMETYQRLWNCVVQPELYVREAGKKKADKEGKLRSAESQDQVNQDFKNDYKTVWFPVDYEFQKKSSGDSLEVQLLEKKNKLFGKLESGWKG